MAAVKTDQLIIERGGELLSTTIDEISDYVGDDKFFMDSPDLIDESDSDHFYMGWVSVNGSWMVRRITRVNSLKVDATVDNNSSYVDLTTAWENKEILTYGS